VTKLTALIATSVVTLKTGTKHELLFNKPASGLNKAAASATIFKPGWKGLLGTNTIANNPPRSVTKEKKGFTPGGSLVE
jgi:hypothetical protein